MTDFNTIFPFKIAETSDFIQLEKQYTSNRADWDAALRFLESLKSSMVSPGRYKLTENGAYATIRDIEAVNENTLTQGYERHRHFIDIHYVSVGEELIRITSNDKLTQCLQPYDPDADIEFFEASDETSSTMLNSSNCLVVFPSDPHKPGIAPTGQISTIRKTVVKIPFIK